MIDLLPLFEKQKQLDEFIIEEKGLQGQDLLAENILALQVELGELANEWKGFKYWSNKPMNREKALVEYVDCLHFILSIGNELSVITDSDWNMFLEDNITNQFMAAFEAVSDLSESYRYNRGKYKMREDYTVLIYVFLGLSSKFGFTWEQIEQAYHQKWEENILRQQTGY